MANRLALMIFPQHKAAKSIYSPLDGMLAYWRVTPWTPPPRPRTKKYATSTHSCKWVMRAKVEQSFLTEKNYDGKI